MEMRCLLLAICMASLVRLSVSSTIGTRFHLVFLENRVEYYEDPPLEVHVTNVGNEDAIVTVSTPKLSCPSETKTVPAGSVVQFNMCWWLRAKVTDYWPAFKTVLVESNRPVMVYGYNKELYSADGFFAIPTNELSTSYYVAAYDDANIATQFAISAVEKTSIEVQLPQMDQMPVEITFKGSVYTNGDVVSMSLEPFETYLAQSRGDLTGARIIATKPIAVFSGNVRNKLSSGSRDHLTEQLIGTGDWDTMFALNAVPRALNYGDMVRVMGRRENTQYIIRQLDGSSTTRVLDKAGDQDDFMIQGPVTIQSVESNKPLQIIQVVRSQYAPQIEDVADPAMFLIIGRNKWLNSYISPALTYQRTNTSYVKNYALISIQDGQEGGLRVDGVVINPVWMKIGGLAMTWLQVNGNSHRFTHTSGTRFGVMVYGASDRESYAFALGADLSNTGCEETLMMRGDEIDNDCDGEVNEESCNEVDDDGDGLVDEDCQMVSVEASGNRYSLMFMENNVGDNPNAMSFLEIYLSAVDVAATVTYTLSNENGDYTRIIQPGEVDIFTDLPVNLRHVGSGKNTKAIHIVADGDLVVYGINKQTFSTDGFVALPNDVVGTEYYTAHYHPGQDLNEFAMVSINPDVATRVTVTMPNRTGSSAKFGSDTVNPGQSYTFDLLYGDSAQFQAVSESANLNGARIVSSHPISVFSGNVRARVDPTTQSSRDHLVQQLAPVNTWGTRFVTLPVPRLMNRGDRFIITASQPSTTVIITIKNADGTMNPEEFKTLQNAGDHIVFDVGSTQYSSLVSNKPIQVFQYVKTSADPNDNADPAMILIPPVSQWSRNYQFVTPRTGQDDGSGGFLPFNTSVMIAVTTNQRNGLRLDGSPLGVSWTEVSGTEYSAAVLSVEQGRHSLTHIDDTINFQALMYGRADRESYGLPLGMRLVEKLCQITTQVNGDGVDNDCDGSVDEELCNGVDDDTDGAVDEDCGAGVTSGTSFYVTFMENEVEYPKGFDLMLYVAVVGSEKAKVNVRAPLVSWPSYDIVSEVRAGEVQAYGFTYQMRNIGQGITGNSIYVRANSDVVVYGVNKELFSNDAFLVYPETSLGSDYYVCTWSPSSLQTEFAVTATVDNTVVTVTLPSNRADILVQANNQNYTAGAQFSVNLDRFQVYQAQSVGDLTGTRIQTSERAAVFSGNVRTLVALSASRDHLVEQMIPTSSYGTAFLVVPFPERTVGDVLKIIARTGNTEVRVNGNLIATLNNGGSFALYNLGSDTTAYITATNPVMVVQFVKSQDGKNNPETGDPSMFVVPSTSNFITTATFITPVYSGGNTPGMDYTNFMTMVIQNGEQGNVRLNSQPLSNANWSSIGSTNYVTTTFQVPSGRSHYVTTTNSNAKFYGRLYGKADRESYAFSVGFKF